MNLAVIVRFKKKEEYMNHLAYKRLLKPSSKIKRRAIRGKIFVSPALSCPAAPVAAAAATAAYKWDGFSSKCGKHGGEFRPLDSPLASHCVAFDSNLPD